MASILVVDDVRDYCEELAIALSREGHYVAVATSGRDAITLGMSVHPDILIADWMLKDHVSGLDVCQALQLVSPTLKTILMTGFASEDLCADARNASVFSFVEKPFPMEVMKEQVREAASPMTRAESGQGIAVIETDPKGTICFANDDAKRLFDDLELPWEGSHVSTVIDASGPARIEDALDDWVELKLAGGSDKKLTARGNIISERAGYMFVLLQEGQRWYRHSVLIGRLLGLPEIASGEIGIYGHVLVIDDSDPVRKVAIETLRHFNCMCHSAKTHEEAIRLFARDGDISHVIVDFEMPDGLPDSIVSLMKELRPGINLVGTSSGSYEREFAQLGVGQFLPKPWDAEKLLSVLQHPA